MDYTFNIYIVGTAKILVYDASEDNETKELMDKYYSHFLDGLFGFYGIAMVFTHKPIGNEYNIDIRVSDNNRLPNEIVIVAAVKHYYEKYNTTNLDIIINKNKYECYYNVDNSQVHISNVNPYTIMKALNGDSEDKLEDEMIMISDEEYCTYVAKVMNIGKFTANMELLTNYVNNLTTYY